MRRNMHICFRPSRFGFPTLAQNLFLAIIPQMKVTQVAICPSEASTKAGQPSLTPELLAASRARHSRNNEGLESILSKIGPGNLDKSVDSIFRMIDYGHQSIADMVPVAIFIDDLSIWLGSDSTAKATSIPARFAPKVIPPAPQKRSTPIRAALLTRRLLSRTP